jgi:hypothetical protein
MFARSGFDVAVDDVFEPAAFARDWRPHLGSARWMMVMLLPTLEETLARGVGRDKHVREETRSPSAPTLRRVAGRRGHRHLRAHGGAERRARRGATGGGSDNETDFGKEGAGDHPGRRDGGRAV